MAEDNYLRSYGDASRKESVIDIIETITATEKQIMNMLGKTKAIDTVHSSLLDTLKTPASGAVKEGDDYSMGSISTPTRLTNIIEIIAQPFAVSRVQQAVDHYHGENELARQTTKAMKDFANSAEFDLIRSSLVSGASGTVPKMAGLIAHISKNTNTTAHTSGTVWSASILKGMMKNNMDNSNDDVATDVFMGSYLKDKTDDFTNKSNVVVNGSNQRQLINAVDIFETGLGKVAVNYHRYVQQDSDATSRVLAIRPEKHKVAYLEETYVDNGLARTGSADKRAVTGSLTLETRNQDSNWFTSGFAKA